LPQGVEADSRRLPSARQRAAHERHDSKERQDKTTSSGAGRRMQGMLLRSHGQGKAGVTAGASKRYWKRERLLRTIQLTVSGCLGPCDVPNVVQVITPEGTEWYGDLDKEAHYQALIDWARACHTTKSLMPRPENETLAPHRFCGFIQGQGPQQKEVRSAEESAPLSCSALPVEPPT
jgi:hypothetical protein